MLSDPLSINRSFKSRKASHSSYPKSMSTSRFESIKGSSWEKLSPILENQRKFGLLAFQSQGLSLRSLGSLTLVQLPAKRSDVPCTELGGSESGNAETLDHSSLALTRTYFFQFFWGTKNTDGLVQISGEQRFSEISIELDVRKAWWGRCFGVLPERWQGIPNESSHKGLRFRVSPNYSTGSNKTGYQLVRTSDQDKQQEFMTLWYWYTCVFFLSELGHAS